MGDSSEKFSKKISKHSLVKIALFENFFLKNCDFLQFLENFVVFCIFLIIDSDFCIFDNFIEIYRKFPII